MKPNFEEFNHFITPTTLILVILKIKIFDNNINKAEKIVIYLYS